MEQSTQWGVSIPNTFPMKKHLKSRNPALNIPRRHEPVATDTVFSDTPAVDSGVKQAQVFVGRDMLVADAYPMKSGKQFVNTLEDNIRRRGAMDKLLSDSAKTEISNKVMDILRAYHISNWHSEPYYQNQNPAQWRYRTIKSWTNTASCPYVNMACQKLLMDMPFEPAEQYLRKLTASHFSTLNMKIANQNVLKRILIAMHNENKADCNENFRICAEESI